MKLLIAGSEIVAQGPFFETDVELRNTVGTYPKSVMDGWQIVDVPDGDVPEDFSTSRYQWNGVTLTLSQAAIDEASADRIADIKAQIANIELENPVTLRGQREQTMIIREIIKQLTGTYPDTYGFNKAAELEEQIAILRAQI